MSMTLVMYNVSCTDAVHYSLVIVLVVIVHNSSTSTVVVHSFLSLSVNFEFRIEIITFTIKNIPGHDEDVLTSNAHAFQIIVINHVVD